MKSETRNCALPQELGGWSNECLAGQGRSTGEGYGYESGFTKGACEPVHAEQGGGLECGTADGSAISHRLAAVNLEGIGGSG